MAIGDDINKSGDDSNKNHDDIGSSSELNLSFGDTLYLQPNDTNGLDESYLSIKSNILTREPLPLVKAAFAVVRGEESHMNATSIGEAKPTAIVFVVKTFNNKRRNFNANTRSVSSNNATADVHSNNASSSNATTNNSPVSLSNEQLSRLMSLLNDNGVSTTNANMASKCFKNIKGIFFSVTMVSVL
ncbi:hypothetical protein Tco_0115090 [Tanacetum coccineum]